MIRILLSAEQREAVAALRRDPTLRPAERDRLGMLALSEAGWSAPRIAAHLGSSTATVRRFFHAFAATGLAAVRRRRPGPPPDAARREVVATALTGLLRQPRTWTSRQLAEALRARAIALSARQVRRHLRRLRARYRRTARSLRHKQDRAKVDAASARLAAHRERAAAGKLTLVYLDEVGFSPSLPTTRSWSLPGDRKCVPYENPQGRRLNLLAGLVAAGRQPALTWWPHARSITSEDLLVFLREGFPDHPRPLVVVLDNASIHTSHAVQDADLARDGIVLEFLPPYSPELNRIEPLFGAIKYHDLAERSYPTLRDLNDAVRSAFQRAEQRLFDRPQPAHQLRPAA